MEGYQSTWGWNVPENCLMGGLLVRQIGLKIIKRAMISKKFDDGANMFQIFRGHEMKLLISDSKNNPSKLSEMQKI